MIGTTSPPPTDRPQAGDPEDSGGPTGLFEQFGIFEPGNGRRYVLTALRELSLSVGISIFGTVIVYFLLKPTSPPRASSRCSARSRSRSSPTS